jgi:seryl-tRNA synthetase
MIDIATFRENPELFRASQRVRGEDPDGIDRILELDEWVRDAQAIFENARAEQTADGALLRNASPEERERLLAEVKVESLAVDRHRER